VVLEVTPLPCYLPFPKNGFFNGSHPIPKELAIKTKTFGPFP